MEDMMRTFAEYARHCLTVLLMLTVTQWGFAEVAGKSISEYRTGLKPLTEEQQQYIDQNWPHIVSVKTNKVGAHRINQYIDANSVKADRVSAFDTSTEDEFTTEVGSSAYRASLGLQTLRPQRLAPSVLPRHVDNTQLPSFPPIGNQEHLGSCVGWATTYYQASHEIGLLNGVNNKVSQQGVLSPKWTYNLLNDGQDGGLDILYTYNLLSQQGAPSIVAFPYDDDYLSWDLDPQHWIQALSNRTTRAQIVEGLGGTSDQVQLVKEMLNNGHVIVIGTFAYSWVMTKVGTDPSVASNPHAGEVAISWMNGRSGGHCVNIVGYDDDIWIDVNNNGRVDTNEKGAFLVANSWGTDWGNQGLVWISYDAFRKLSAVPGGPNVGRVPLADIVNTGGVAVNPKALHYKPSLIAQYTLNQNIRNQISVFVGVSDTTMTSPTQTSVVTALMQSGGPFEFDGNKPDKVTSATFVTDFTDLIATAGPHAAQRFYLFVTDTTPGSATTLTQYSLIDVIRGTQIDCPGLPVVVDNSMISKYIDYDVTIPAPSDSPTVAITSPANGSAVSGVVQVVVQAKSNAGITHVDLYVNNTLQGTATNAPYLFSVDTAQLSGDQAIIKAVAFDEQKQQAETSISVSLNKATTSYFINVGGEPVKYRGTNWSADQLFEGTSSVASSLFPFANSVYATQRIGNFSYHIPIQNGKYLLKLKFADLFGQLSGNRTFNVIVNGTPVISKLNLYHVAGFAKPYDRHFQITVTNSSIDLQFVPVSADGQAVLNGIAITPIQ
jgi:C1A family cysteine protease